MCSLGPRCQRLVWEFPVVAVLSPLHLSPPLQLLWAPPLEALVCMRARVCVYMCVFISSV